jgi:hypothetical protein
MGIKDLEEGLIEPAPALEVHFDDIGNFTLIGSRLWFPMFVRRPALFGNERHSNHIVAWGITNAEIIPGAACRALRSIGHASCSACRIAGCSLS